MSQWHREHPELAGTDADPWMQHDDYRRAYGRTVHHHRDLRTPSAGGEDGPPSHPSSQETGSASPAVDHRCDVCGAPPGYHHLSHCDLRGEA